MTHHLATKANISNDKSSNKNKKSHNNKVTSMKRKSQRGSDIREELPQHNDIKEEIVDRIDQCQKVFNMTLGDIRVINLITTDSVQFKKHIDIDNIDHPMSDNIASEFRSIDIMIENTQDSFVNELYITSKNNLDS